MVEVHARRALEKLLAVDNKWEKEITSPKRSFGVKSTGSATAASIVILNCWTSAEDPWGKTSPQVMEANPCRIISTALEAPTAQPVVNRPQISRSASQSSLKMFSGGSLLAGGKAAKAFEERHEAIERTSSKRIGNRLPIE